MNMIPMRAPRDVLSLSVGGSQFPVVNGVVQVPPAYVKHALAHKFLLLDGGNADELIASDLDAALRKAQAAIPVRAFIARPGTKSLMIEGTSYPVAEDGYVALPETHTGIAQILGCKPAAMRKDDDPDAPTPFTEQNAPRDEAGMRLDGPTLPQYIKAGYKAENYPPRGYADKRTAEELEAAKPKADGAGDALPTMQELAKKTDPDIRAWLKERGVDFLADAKRKDMNKAAADFLAKQAEEAKAKG